MALIPSEKERKEKLSAYTTNSKVSSNVDHEAHRIAHVLSIDKNLHTNISKELALYGFCLIVKADPGAIILDPDSYQITIKGKSEESGYTWSNEPPQNGTPTLHFCYHNDLLYQWWLLSSTNTNNGIWVRVRTI